MLAVQPIRTGEDPILRQPCNELIEFDSELEELLTDLADTLRKHRGLGLAAPQIGISRQAIVIDIGEGPLELVNPQIVSSEGSQPSVEGCLSFPGITLELTRPRKVLVRAKNRKGEAIQMEAEGLLAGVLCHEIDHLHGVLFFDHLSDDEFFRQFFQQVEQAETSPPAYEVERGKDGGANGDGETQDFQLAADLIADSAWKLELAIDLLREAASSDPQLPWLAKTATRLNQLAEKWETTIKSGRERA